MHTTLLLFANWLETLGADTINKIRELTFAHAPKVLGAIVLFIIGWFIAKLVQWFISRLLQRLGVNNLVAKLQKMEMFQGRLMTFDLARILSKLVYMLIMLIVIIATVDILGIQGLSDFIVNAMNYLPRLFTAVVVIIAGLWLADLLKKIITGFSQSIGMGSYKVMGDLLFYFVLINVVMVGLNLAGIPTSILTDNIKILLGGAVAAFALGYGIASQETIVNYLASFYTRDKVFVGSVIRVGDREGLIIEKDASSVTMQTPEGHKIIIPMSTLSRNQVEIIEENLLDEGMIEDIREV